MRSSRIAACVSFLFAVLPVAVGGCSAGDDEPAGLGDPDFLPTGTYSLRIVAASCNVNPTFQSTDRVALFRNAAGAAPGANVPLPTKIGPETESSIFGTVRQDVDLSTRHVDLVVPDPKGCGSVPATVDVTAMTSSELALSYREDALESCDVPACSVEYVLELVEAACPADCNSSGATLHAGPSGSMIWRCDCQ